MLLAERIEQQESSFAFIFLLIPMNVAGVILIVSVENLRPLALSDSPEVIKGYITLLNSVKGRHITQ